MLAGGSLGTQDFEMYTYRYAIDSANWRLPSLLFITMTLGQLRTRTQLNSDQSRPTRKSV